MWIRGIPYHCLRVFMAPGDPTEPEPMPGTQALAATGIAPLESTVVTTENAVDANQGGIRQNEL